MTRRKYRRDTFECNGLFSIGPSPKMFVFLMSCNLILTWTSLSERDFRKALKIHKWLLLLSDPCVRKAAVGKLYQPKRVLFQHWWKTEFEHSVLCLKRTSFFIGSYKELVENASVTMASFPNQLLWVRNSPHFHFNPQYAMNYFNFSTGTLKKTTEVQSIVNWSQFSE